MAVDTLAAVLNILLDYAWIFGHWGFPQAGVAGAAGATAVSQWVRAGIYWAGRAAPLPRPVFSPRLPAARFFLFRRVWRFGGPSGLQFLVESGAFTLLVLLVGRLGNDRRGCHHPGVQCQQPGLLPHPRTGHRGDHHGRSAVGAQPAGVGRPAPRPPRSGSPWPTPAIAVLYLVVPGLFLAGYAAGASPAEFARLRGTVVILLRFVAAYSLFDAMNIIFCGAIKGAGDTRFILVVTAVMSIAPVVVAWLGIAAGGGLLWCWVVLTAWTCGLGVIYLARYTQGRWREMRVIEPERLSGDHALLSEPAIAIHWGQAGVVGDEPEREGDGVSG